MKRLSALAAAGVVACAAAPAHAANPDVAVVGDFRYHTNFPDPSPDLDRLQIHEVELSIQGYLSPFSKADFFLSHNADSDLELEEGFLTLTDLPGEVQARIGHWKMPFGKLNAIHPEKWDFIDPPLVFTNLLGGEDGWKDTGAELTGYVPNPWDQLISLTGDVVLGENPVAFATSPTVLGRGPVGNLRLGTYFPFDDVSGLEVGMGGASQLGTPHGGADRASLGGLDLRYRWRPDPATSFTLLSEFMQLLSGNEAPSGEYLSADYQWAVAHDVDLRLDRSFAPGGSTPGLAASLTYGFSIFETTKFKVQYEHTFAKANAAPYAEDRIMAQTVFVLGPHKHPLTF